MDAGRRNLLLIIVGGLLVLLLAIGAVRLHRQVRPVAALTVAYAPFSIALPESGVVQYPQIQTISSLIPGSIGHVFVKAGDRVRAGSLLATIVNPEILSNAQSSGAAYRSASARAAGTQVTDTSNVVQAEANLEAARARLSQAEQDVANGVQSGLGYGETTAADQRAQADANLTTAATGLREAHRLFLAYQNLYGNKAVSRDQLEQAEAKYEQAQAAYNQARVARESLSGTQTRSRGVLEYNLHAAQEGVAQAQAALVAARVASGSGDAAAAAAEAARAGSEYGFARAQAAATQVRAPYDATVLSVATEKADPLRPLQPGDAIVAGQPLVTLAAKRAFVVRTRVDEQDVIGVRLGERVRITGEDFPGRVLSGKVVEISPIAQASSGASAERTVATTIAVDAPPAFLRDGMSADVEILTTDLPQAIVVPNESILREGGATYVYVIEDGSAHRRPVRVGPSSESGVVISGGLNAGDVVVAQSVSGLAEGTAVSVSPARPGAKP